jgi:c-di-GMP-binding flagellar brake protein YcgR
VLDIDETTDAATAARLRYLAPGLAVRVSVLGDAVGAYACSIVETDGERIWIDLPIRRDGMLHLERGQLVSVRFDRPDDAAYLFDSAVAEVRDDDRSPFGLAVPVTIDRRPHRADARLPLVLDGTLRTDVGEVAAKVVDLSAGGLGVVCERELPEGGQVVVRVALPGPDGEVAVEQTASIRTVSMYGRTPGGATLHHYGLAFVEADEVVREQILSSVIWNLTRNPSVL